MEIFKAWPKIPRVENRKEFYTEKIDGTNACIIILEIPLEWVIDDKYLINYIYIEDGEKSKCYGMWCQSRNKLIKPVEDNAGFAQWVFENRHELFELGEGYHYGEWWGKGIQRGYNQDRKRFSLFNTARWGEHNPQPKCCDVVPTIHANSVEEAKAKLIENGSFAAPGFMNVEGVVVFEYNTKTYWKAIINK